MPISIINTIQPLWDSFVFSTSSRSCARYLSSCKSSWMILVGAYLSKQTFFWTIRSSSWSFEPWAISTWGTSKIESISLGLSWKISSMISEWSPELWKFYDWLRYASLRFELCLNIDIMITWANCFQRVVLRFCFVVFEDWRRRSANFFDKRDLCWALFFLPFSKEIDRFLYLTSV